MPVAASNGASRDLDDEFKGISVDRVGPVHPQGHPDRGHYRASLAHAMYQRMPARPLL